MTKVNDSHVQNKSRILNDLKTGVVNKTNRSALLLKTQKVD